MVQSGIQNEDKIQSEQPVRSNQRKSIQRKWLPTLNWNGYMGKKLLIGSNYRFLLDRQDQLALLRSQVLLFNSRKKWGFLFALATLSGLFCVPSAINEIQVNLSGAPVDMMIFSINMILPVSTLLIITGMYVLNDLFDSDLDRINGKTDRPIQSGKVSKKQALVFVVFMNFIGL